MNPSIETLVHISGPSRGTDDARYRREVQGLLDFEPVSRHDISSLHDERSKKHKDAAQESIVQTKNVTPVQALEDLADKLLPVIAENTTPYGAETSYANAFRSAVPVPSMQDASKNDTTVPQTATRPTPQMLIERTPAIPRRHTTPTAVTPAAGGPSHRRTRSDSWKTPPSVIPDSQPTQLLISRPHISSSPCLRRPFAPSSSPSPMHDDDLPSRKRHCVQETSNARSAPGNGVSRDVQQVTSFSTDALQETPPPPLCAPSSLVIHPPRPRPSKAQFETHLTPSLQTLSAQLPLGKYFKPAVHIRSPAKLERGHWFVPIQAWNEDLKNRFWQFLARFVGEGRAGWGVWCSREFRGDMQLTGSSKENKDPNTREEVVRMYCWGEVMGELWLLLFVASERQIKGTGARWNDAQQKMAVQMA